MIYTLYTQREDKGRATFSLILQLHVQTFLRKTSCPVMFVAFLLLYLLYDDPPNLS
jgi:hypothetical protein